MHEQHILVSGPQSGKSSQDGRWACRCRFSRPETRGRRGHGRLIAIGKASRGFKPPESGFTFSCCFFQNFDMTDVTKYADASEELGGWSIFNVQA